MLFKFFIAFCGNSSICLEDIESQEIDWLWYPYIPYGKITIIQGDPGEGKTTFALQLASILSRGLDFSGEYTNEPINIIYQTAEDGLADTIKPRLERAKADCSKILVIDDGDIPLSLNDRRIESAIKRTNAKLLIFDPFQAYLGYRVDMNRANEIRTVTNSIASLAEKTGCAVILIGHMNKGTGTKAVYRGIGSIDIFAIARSVLLVGRVPNKPNIRAIAQIKNNLAEEGDTVAFKLDKDSLMWLGSYDISVDEMLGNFSFENKREKAEDMLIELLKKHESYPTNEIIVKGKELGVSKRTLENVKQELGIKSIRKGKSWHWSRG